MQRNNYFLDEKEYKRYIIGKFKNDDFVPKKLKEYGELCIDSPKLSSYQKIGEFTIIDCKVELINRGCFLDLINYLSQDGEEAYAIAVNENKSYFATIDRYNVFGDTVLVKFDDGSLIKWELPLGLCNDYAVIEDYDLSCYDELLKYNCREFLLFIGADKVIEYLNL